MIDYQQPPEPKSGHIGVNSFPFGEEICLIVRHDGKMVGVAKDRHEAAWKMYNYHDCDDYEVRQMPVGLIPIEDLGFKIEEQ